MKGKSPVCCSSKRAASVAWNIKIADRFMAREVKVKRGGTSGTSGSGPTGYKTNRARLLARSLAERAGVNIAVRKRQVEAVAAKAAVPVIIYGPLP